MIVTQRQGNPSLGVTRLGVTLEAMPWRYASTQALVLRFNLSLGVTLEPKPWRYTSTQAAALRQGLGCSLNAAGLSRCQLFTHHEASLP